MQVESVTGANDAPVTFAQEHVLQTESYKVV